MLPGRAYALILLGFSFARTLLRRLTHTVSGLVQFWRNYGADRLAPLNESERALLPKLSKCIACGRCDMGDVKVAQHAGLMQIVLASTRSIPDFDAAHRAWVLRDKEMLKEKEKMCPVGIPFRELLEFVDRKAQWAAGKHNSDGA